MELLGSGEIGEESLGSSLDVLPLSFGSVGNGCLAPLSACLRAKSGDKEGEEVEVVLANLFWEDSEVVSMRSLVSVRWLRASTHTN